MEKIEICKNCKNDVPQCWTDCCPVCGAEIWHPDELEYRGKTCAEKTRTYFIFTWIALSIACIPASFGLMAYLFFQASSSSEKLMGFCCLAISIIIVCKFLLAITSKR